MSKLLEYALNITDGEHGTVIDSKDGDYYLLSNKNIVDNEIIITSEDRKIDKETFNKINRRTKLEKDDVVIATVGTIGKTAVLKDNINYVFQRSVGIIKTDQNRLNPYYLKYLLDTEFYQKKMRKISNGAVQRCLYLDAIKNIDVNIPSIKEQQKRVDSLVKIDDKFIINQNIMNEFEAIIDEVYKYWFIQYDFPNNEGNPYKSSGGKMVYNDEIKIEIPEGWSIKRIDEIEKNIITGKTPSTKDEDNFNGDIPFITIEDIRQNLFIGDTIRKLSEKGANSQIKKYIPEDSICVTCIATVGLVGITTKKSQTNQQINSIICENKNNLYYLVNAIKNYFKYSSGAKTGNIFDNMNKEDFASIKIVYPPEDILKKYYNRMHAIYEEIKRKRIENEKLKGLKDYLLPLLMNENFIINKEQE